jgi:SAM-dependent methyltransferase
MTSHDIAINAKPFRRLVRRMGHRLGIWSDWEQVLAQLRAPGEQRHAGWYDAVYQQSLEYKQPYYSSVYYPTWLLVADRLRSANTASILDIGCGSGQFAAMLREQGFERYTGMDFSSTAVQQAQQLVPSFTFIVADATDIRTYEGLAYDIVVCMELLEHVEQDLAVLANIRPGVKCLCTVPNFPYVSHVRHFDAADEVAARYGHLFDGLVVTPVKGTRGADEWFYLMDGVRNSSAARTAHSVL